MASSSAPFTSFNFLVEIEVAGVSNQVCSAMFSDVDGLEKNLEPKTIREGGNNTGPVHMAGQVGYGQLTLKRGMSPNFDLWTWFDAVAAPGGGGLRGSATIVMLGGDGTKQIQFQLTGLLPVKLKAPAFNGLSPVAAHKLIYAALEEPWGDESIHELRINTKGTAQ